MRFIFNQKVGFILLLICVAAVSTSLVYILFWTGNTAIVTAKQGNSTQQTTSTSSTSNVTPTVLPQPCVLKQRNVEMGISFPQWNVSAYSGSDNKWLAELPQMRSQTASCWVQMPVLFHQDSLFSTMVMPGKSTPSVGSFAEGIQYAHSLGLHVFVTILLGVGGHQPWAGAIQLTTFLQQQQWFTSYWKAIQPYAVAAAQAGAEQFAMGTEEEWLQENAPVTLWNNLITNVHNAFPGILTYDMNWTSLQKPLPTWMRNPLLKTIGVSSYLPVISVPQRVNPAQMPALWASTVKHQLDAFATLLDKPVLISEIGYRNSSDDFYEPWVTHSSASADPKEQAGACGAALVNALADPQILGIFFWGWDDTGAMDLKGTQAAATIHQYYASMQV